MNSVYEKEEDAPDCIIQAAPHWRCEWMQNGYCTWYIKCLDDNQLELSPIISALEIMIHQH